MGLKVVQIICLCTFFTLIPVIIFREKRFTEKTFFIIVNHPLLNSSYLLLISIFLYITKNWFTKVEFNVLLIVLIPAAIIVLYDLVTNFYATKIRISSVTFILLSIILMSQKNPNNDTVSYQSLHFGISNGTNLSQCYNGYKEDPGGCSGMDYSQYFKERYYLAGAGYSYFLKDINKTVEFRLNGFYGNLYEEGQTTLNFNKTPIYGINPFVKLDWYWFGGGLGVNWGNLILIPDKLNQNPFTYTIPETCITIAR